MLFLFCKVFDNIAACDEADKSAEIIDDGDEILIDRFGKQILHRGVDLDGGNARGDERIDLFLLGHLHIGKAFIEDPPEKIALADRADIIAVLVDNGDLGVAACPHSLKPLSQRITDRQVCNAAFGTKEKQNIHDYSFCVFNGAYCYYYTSFEREKGRFSHNFYKNILTFPLGYSL